MHAVCYAILTLSSPVPKQTDLVKSLITSTVHVAPNEVGLAEDVAVNGHCSRQHPLNIVEPLLQLSTKARDNGERYASMTARKAAEAVECRPAIQR